MFNSTGNIIFCTLEHGVVRGCYLYTGTSGKGAAICNAAGRRYGPVIWFYTYGGIYLYADVDGKYPRSVEGDVIWLWYLVQTSHVNDSCGGIEGFQEFVQ